MGPAAPAGPLSPGDPWCGARKRFSPKVLRLHGCDVLTLCPVTLLAHPASRAPRSSLGPFAHTNDVVQYLRCCTWPPLSSSSPVIPAHLYPPRVTENTSLSVSWNEIFLELPHLGPAPRSALGTACLPIQRYFSPAPPRPMQALPLGHCRWVAPGLILGDSTERPPLPGVSSYTWLLLKRKVTFSFPLDFRVIISLKWSVLS